MTFTHQLTCRLHGHDIKNIQLGQSNDSESPEPSKVCTRCLESRWWLHRRRTQMAITVEEGVLDGWFVVKFSLVDTSAASGTSSPSASSAGVTGLQANTMMWSSVIHLNTVKDLLVAATKEFSAAERRLSTVLVCFVVHTLAMIINY